MSHAVSGLGVFLLIVLLLSNFTEAWKYQSAKVFPFATVTCPQVGMYNISIVKNLLL